MPRHAAAQAAAAAEFHLVPSPSASEAAPQALQLEVQRLRVALMLSRAREESLRLLAAQDALTGLPNRRGFESLSLQALSRHNTGGHEFGLLFVDLDGFKTINDQYGHDIGDELLKVIGSRLGHAVREGDTVSRHGGDEFVCLLADVRGEAQAASIARKLHEAVSAPCQVGPLKVSVQPSIGIALFPRDATKIAALVRKADHAMRWAKQERLGQAFFGHAPKKLRISSRARAAGKGLAQRAPPREQADAKPPA